MEKGEGAGTGREFHARNNSENRLAKKMERAKSRVPQE